VALIQIATAKDRRAEAIENADVAKLFIIDIDVTSLSKIP
jgi:hypothetical protein